MLHQILTVVYILSGMVIMGILAGAVGQKMLVAVGNLTDRVELKITQAVTYLQEQMSHRKDQTDSSVSSYNKALADDATQLQYSPMKAVLSSFTSMAVILGIGTLVYMQLEEEMSPTKALYFTVVTVTTVGFGDIYPESDSSKVFSLFFVPVGVIFFAKAMSAISDVPIRNRAAKLESYVLNQFLRKLTTYDLSSLQRSVDLQDGAPITKNDFCLAVLLRLGRVSPEDLERIEAIFFALDSDRCAHVYMLLWLCLQLVTQKELVGAPIIAHLEKSVSTAQERYVDARRPEDCVNRGFRCAQRSCTGVDKEITAV